MTVGARLMTKEPQFDSSETEQTKRKALEALESRGSRHDAATAADVGRCRYARGGGDPPGARRRRQPGVLSG